MILISTECNDRNIPLPIQREIRKRCGFGCILCGFPLYQYHHIYDWVNVKRHNPAEIVLLCDGHHTEATRGLLPRKKINKAKKKPYNLKKGISKPYSLHFEGNSCEVYLGNNYFTIQRIDEPIVMIPLMIDCQPLIWFNFENDNLLLNLIQCDENNKVFLRIIDNHLFYLVNPWDIQFIGKTLIIREKAYKLLIKLKFEPPNKITIKKGRFFFNGVKLLISEKQIYLYNNRTKIRGFKGIGCQGGLIIGKKPKGLSCAFSISGFKRNFR